MIKLNRSNTEHSLSKRDPDLSCVTLFSQAKNKYFLFFPPFNFYVSSAEAFEIQHALRRAAPANLAVLPARGRAWKWESSGSKAWSTDLPSHELRQRPASALPGQTALLWALGSPSRLVPSALSVNRCHMWTALIELMRFNGTVVGKQRAEWWIAAIHPFRKLTLKVCVGLLPVFKASLKWSISQELLNKI